MRAHVPSVRRSCLVVSLFFAVALLRVPVAEAGFERTEVRTPCADFDPLRSPFFGDTHVHTRLSFDGATGDVREGPRAAYDFAKGNPIDLPPYVAGVAQRSAQLRRPLDFTVITDHQEFLGETSICLEPSAPGYSSPECEVFRDNIPQEQPGAPPAFITFVAPYLGAFDPVRHPFCGPTGDVCTTAAGPVWQDIQDAAEEHYDRTAACTFTSFVGYEYTGAPVAQNVHRNVVFRTDVVPPLPPSYVEEPTAEGFLSELRSQCQDSLPGCDALAIPHNSNLSNGLMYRPELADGTPFAAEDAALRAEMEPIVEIMQHKGDSECRVGVLSNDELCGFEKMTGHLIGIFPGPPASYDPLAFVRNVLKEGLEQEEALGVNPYPLGLLAATDTHNAIPGLTHEADYGPAGHLGTRDATPELMLEGPDVANTLGGIESNAGGLAVVWAEENSRDAIFSAMRRRELYGTSGTRPLVRFFAGNIPANACGGDDFAEKGYTRGVPMGGELGAVRNRRSPRFAVLALRDGGTPGSPGTALQRVQIVKGWVDGSGTAQETVYEVAGDPDNGASVDPNTCGPIGVGFDTLCTVWEDPAFDPDERAFYYARVIENPTCRWSTLLCRDEGVDCSDPGTIGPGFEHCCDGLVEEYVQERAWTSPVFYRPESLGRVSGWLQPDAAGLLRLSARFHRIPDTLDLAAQDLTLEVRDDDVIWEVTIPAGTLDNPKPGLYRFRDPSGALLNGLRVLTLKVRSGGDGILTLQTVRTDLSNAEAEDHDVELRLSAGNWTAQHARRWEMKGSRLRVRP